MNFMTFHILGMSSSQLTFIFFRGVGIPPTRKDRTCSGVGNPFWQYWTSPEKVAMALTIYRFWLGDVQWGHLMTHDVCGDVSSGCETPLLMIRLGVILAFIHLLGLSSSIPLALILVSEGDSFCNCCFFKIIIHFKWESRCNMR